MRPAAMGNNVTMASDDDRAKPRGDDPPKPKPGLTAPLDDLTEEEREKESPGVLPGAGPDDAHQLAERKRELEREGRPWGWEDEEEQE
jgi:hypothetical protein